MKRIVLLGFLMVLMLSSLTAKDLKRINYTKTFVNADTLGWTDTTLGDWERIEGATRLHFYVDLVAPRGGAIDTNFGADSFFINIQFSLDKKRVTKTIEIDTLLDTGAGWTGNDALVADSLRGAWMRAMLIHRDTTNVPAGVVGNTYGKGLIVYYTLTK